MQAQAATETTVEAAPSKGKSSSKKKSGKKKSGKKKSNKKKSGKKKSGQKKSGKAASDEAKPEGKPENNDGSTEAEAPAAEGQPDEASEDATLEALKESAPPLLPTPSTKAVPEPEPGVEVVTPIRVRGKLSRGSRGTLVRSLKSALAAAAFPDEALQARLQVNASRKKRFGLTLTIADTEGSTRAEVTDACESCSVDDAAALLEGLVAKAATQLQPPPQEAGPATITVRSDPSGASLRVGGTQHGMTPQTVELEAGDHELVIGKLGFTELRQTLTVTAGQERELELKLVPATTADPKAGRGWTIGGAIALGLGVAGAATGAALILVDETAAPLKCSPDQVDFRGICRHRYDTLLGGIIGAAAGGAGIATGIGLLIKGHMVKVDARGGRDSASMTVTLRF